MIGGAAGAAPGFVPARPRPVIPDRRCLGLYRGDTRWSVGIERFSTARMADGYERLMLAVAADAGGAGERPAVHIVPGGPGRHATLPADPAVAV